MLVHAANTSLLLLNYRVNKEFIIENFCENTDRPEMHCNGKCHLKKQIEQEQNQRSENPVSAESVSLVLAFEELQDFRFIPVVNSTSNNERPYFFRNYSMHLVGVFRPPQV